MYNIGRSLSLSRAFHRSSAGLRSSNQCQSFAENFQEDYFVNVRFAAEMSAPLGAFRDALRNPRMTEEGLGLPIKVLAARFVRN
jgi:hypothetical protein